MDLMSDSNKCMYVCIVCMNQQTNSPAVAENEPIVRIAVQHADDGYSNYVEISAVRLFAVWF